MIAYIANIIVRIGIWVVWYLRRCGQHAPLYQPFLALQINVQEKARSPRNMVIQGYVAETGVPSRHPLGHPFWGLRWFSKPKAITFRGRVLSERNN